MKDILIHTRVIFKSKKKKTLTQLYNDIYDLVLIVALITMYTIDTFYKLCTLIIIQLINYHPHSKENGRLTYNFT